MYVPTQYNHRNTLVRPDSRNQTTPQDLTLSETMANPFSQHPQFQNEALGQHPSAENTFNGQDQPGQPLSPFADALLDSQNEPMSPLIRNLISLV